MNLRFFAFIIALAIAAGSSATPAVAASKSLVAASREGVPDIKASAAGTLVVVNKTSRAQITFTTRVTFDWFTGGGLPIEGYENGNVPAGAISGCVSPMSSTTNDPACVTPGDILVGIETASVNFPGANGLAMLGAGFAGNPTRTVVANYFTDSENINFAVAQRGCAWGADLQSYFSGVALTVSIFDPALVLTGSYTVPASSIGTFFGVADDTSDIARVNLFDATGANAEGGDSHAYGGPLECIFPVDLQSFAVE